ncbi:MAG: hypothetical protein ACM3O9_09530 [Methylocystaceae bacterium]
MSLGLAYQGFSDEYQRQRAVKNDIDDRIIKLKQEAADLEDRQEVWRQVSQLFLLAAEYARANACTAMEKIVTTGLRSVFANDLAFHIELDTARTDRPEASFLVASSYGGNAQISNEPRDARGGGVVDIIALALRVAFIEISDPPVEGPLILDEPAKHVSEEFMPGVAAFIRQINDSFGRQIILITHNHELEAAGDLCYQFTQQEGKTYAIKI